MFPFLLLLFLVKGSSIPVDPRVGGKTGLRLDTLDARGLRSLIEADTSDVFVLNVWATWCKPCKKELPELIRLRDRYRAQDVRVELLSADEVEIARSEVLPALQAAGANFLSYIKHESFKDEQMILQIDSGWSGALPATFLFHKRGKRVQTLVGERTYRDFEAAVLQELKR